MRGHHHRRRFPGEETEPGERSTTRVQLEMPPQAMERLQKLKDRTEAASYAEVIRNALRLYEARLQRGLWCHHWTVERTRQRFQAPWKGLWSCGEATAACRGHCLLRRRHLCTLHGRSQGL